MRIRRARLCAPSGGAWGNGYDLVESVVASGASRIDILSMVRVETGETISASPLGPAVVSAAQAVTSNAPTVWV